MLALQVVDVRKKLGACNFEPYIGWYPTSRCAQPYPAAGGSLCGETGVLVLREVRVAGFKQIESFFQ